VRGRVLAACAALALGVVLAPARIGAQPGPGALGQSDGEAAFTLEVAKPFFEDGCRDLHDSQPVVPAWVRAYPNQAACLKEHPTRWDRRYEMYSRQPSPCCLYEVKERHPGERIATSQRWPFIFDKLAWRAYR